MSPQSAGVPLTADAPATTKPFLPPDPAPPRRFGRRKAFALVLAAAVLVPTLCVLLPVPGVDALVTNVVSGQIAAKLACPGSAAPKTEVGFGGGRLLPQLLGDELDEIRLNSPDTAMGGAKHAAFAATIRGVHGLRDETPVADSLDATVTIAFPDLPPPPTGPAPQYAVGKDGELLVSVTPTPEQAADVVSVLYLKLELHGGSVWAVPQKMRIFGKELPAAKVAGQAGGIRKQPLPELPAGLAYRWIRPQSDGIHVALDGTVVQPLSTLPTKVGSRTVSFSARNGRLGISTSESVLSFIDVPLTIWTAPRITGNTLVLEPVSVEILGKDRPPSDLIAKEVLKKVDRKDLARTLPVLPAGVRYQRVWVDGGGVHVMVGGVTVQPFSSISADESGPPSTFAATDGFLTATTKGAKGKPVPLVLHSRPRITGSTLDLAPTSAELFGGVLFDPYVVLGRNASSTKVPLQPLGKGLQYRGVDVLPDALRVHVGGTNVALGADLAGGTGCGTT